MNCFAMPKRVLSSLLCLFLGLAIALTLPQINSVQAAELFYWESINVDLDVQTNGDMWVTETQRYVFESDYSNQRYRYIRLDKVDGIEDVSVQENNQTLDSIVTTENTVENKQIKIQWSHPLNPPETHTFVLKYRVVGGLHVSGSTTEVFWRAIFVDRSAPVKAAKVTVHLPEALAGSVTSFRSFHALTEARQIDPRTFEFIVQHELPPQQTLEVQVSFPSQILNVPQPQWQRQSNFRSFFNLPFLSEMWPAFLILFVLSSSLCLSLFAASRANTRECPECKTRSLKRKKVKVLSRPDRYREGQKQEDWDCASCHYHSESIVVIPLSSWVSSNDGGGAYDGGRYGSGDGGGGGCGGGGGGCGGGGGGCGGGG